MIPKLRHTKRRKNSKTYKVTVADAVWWTLFKINIGDKIVTLDDGREGIVFALSVPMSHKAGRDVKIQYFEKTEYVISYERYSLRLCKRWEIRKR